MTQANRTRKRKSRCTFGSISELPSGRYRASYLGPDHKRHAADETFPTVADADCWLAIKKAEITKRTWRPPEPALVTFESFATRWLELGVGRNGKPLSPTTKELYGILWRRWLRPAFGDTALGDLSKEQFGMWLAETRATHEGSTQPDKAYRLARTILNIAVDSDKIPANPCRVQGAGRESSPERPTATEEQVLNIADAIDDRYRAMVVLAAWESLRFGELAGLRRGRVNPMHRRIVVMEQAVELAGGKVVFKSPKWDSERTADISSEVAEVLDEHLERYVGPKDDDLVFTSPEGHPLRRTKFRARWDAACRSAGVVGLHFHDLRGSGATWAAQEGATLRELMDRLGHRTHTAALRYQHATDERRREIADRMAARMRADATEPTAQVAQIRSS